MIDGLAQAAGAALEECAASILFRLRDGCKIDSPKIDIAGIQKGHAVGVNLTFAPDTTNNANDRFLVGVEIANDDFLLGGQFVGRNDSRAVPAKQHGLRHFRETLAVHVASSQKDSELLRDAT